MPDNMNISDLKSDENLGKDFVEHEVFKTLTYYAEFYDSLSFLIMNWIAHGTLAVYNLDTYTYSSIKGTIESINDVLKKGRINDAYALLRKYYDSTLINIYVNLFIKDHMSLENMIVKQIDDWIKGISRIPNYRVIAKYIKDSPRLKEINELLYKDTTYERIRERCNDNTHYNFYRNLLLNDNQIVNPNRIKYLELLSHDIEYIFILHFAYLFSINDHYMMSSDYIDYLDVGLTPEDDSQYWVAGFIQEAYNKIIKAKRPDIADEIKRNSSMHLE